MPNIDYLEELLSPNFAGPYISIYQPTHRQHPDNRQDPILFKNQLRQVQDSLGERLPPEQVTTMMEALHKLAGDTEFWNHTPDGIAVFCAADYFRVISLQRPTPTVAVVADSFHVKPLLRIVQSADRFHVLCISRESVRLLEGNRDELDEIELHNEVPLTVEDVIGEDLPEPVNRVRTVPGTGAGVAAELRHGHGARDDVVDQQTERFFRAVDRELQRLHSAPSGLPLILAGLPENQSLFRSVSQNNQLLEHGIEGNPDAMSRDELRIQAWKQMEPMYLERLAGFVDQFHAARNVQRASADLSDVAAAAVEGRVKVMLVEAERQVPGRMDTDTGKISLQDSSTGVDDELLDDIAEKVLRTGGEVIMVPSERMPVDTGLAAIYRY